MKYIFFCFLFLIKGCKPSKDKGNFNVVIGTTANEKAGAVLSSNGEVYLISGLQGWDSIYLGKKIKVRGHFNLKVGEDKRNMKIENTRGKFAAQMYPRYYLVTDATWELHNLK